MMKVKTVGMTVFLFLFMCISFQAAAQENEIYYEEYGVWFDSSTQTVTKVEESVKELNLPEQIDRKKVVKIGEKAAYDHQNLKKVTLPDSVTAIEAQAFAGCENLESVVLSNQIEEIGKEAFIQCKKLKEIKLPDSLKVIHESAFLGCSKLEKVVLPQEIATVGEGAFSYCEHLTEITVSEKNKNYSSQDGVLFNGDQTKLLQYPIGKQASSYQISETVQEIGNGGFAYSHLKNVSFPSGLKKIGEFAFFDCDIVETIHVPEGVTAIGKEAFAWCDRLEEITLPNGISSLEYGLFWYSKNLSRITLPGSLRVIDAYAFSRCEKLQELTLPDGVTSLGEESFAYCTGLKKISLPVSLQTVGKKAFLQCTGLGIMTVKNGAAIFESSSLEGCGAISFFTPEHSLMQQFAADRGDAWEKIVVVTLQGKELSFDQPPVTRYDRTLVPVRAIFEAMGAEVSWDEESQTVTASRNGITLSLQIGNQTMTKNGETIVLDVPALQVNDRTVVPVRAVAEGFSCDIYWEEETQTVSIWEKEI